MVDVTDRVGPYRILRLLNNGGQGTVYLGYDDRLRRRVAIKIYDLPTRRGARRWMLREAQTVASLDSAKIVRVYDVIETPEHVALVMEYVPGTDLEYLLKAVRLSLASAVTVAGDIAAALAIARQQNIVHADLKAANILISGAGRAKLTDFGIARRAGTEQTGVFNGGSPTALSPEQVMGKPLDVRSDLFALGCLMYRMLSGEHPFMRDGEVDAGLLLSVEPPPLKERVPREMAVPDTVLQLVDAMLHKDPAARPRNTHQVRRVLHEVSRGIPLSANDSLLRQARPYFRTESQDEIPLPLPADFGRHGRSRRLLSAVAPWNLRYRMALLSRRARLTVALGALVTLALPLYLFFARAPRPVYFEEPVVHLIAPLDLPREISGRWLSAQVIRGVSGQLGSVQVLDRRLRLQREVIVAGAPDDWPGKSADHVQIDLRCETSLCVLVLARRHKHGYQTRQNILFPEMPLSQWTAIVRTTAASLYR